MDFSPTGSANRSLRIAWRRPRATDRRGYERPLSLWLRGYPVLLAPAKHQIRLLQRSDVPIGVIGMLIVDPLTGAMYNLTPEKIEQSMSASQAKLIRNGQGLLIILASQATQRERDDMVRVN